jgi:uncharacterized protein
VIEPRDGETTLRYMLDAATLPVPRRRGRPRYDSRFESALAADFADKLGADRDGWSLTREDAPVAAGETVFLPDFTARHRDGREALIEIVGFWTPEYLEEKVRKLRETRVSNLVLVVYRGLDAGGAGEALAAATDAPIVWFGNKPRIGPIMEAVGRVAVKAGGGAG